MTRAPAAAWLPAAALAGAVLAVSMASAGAHLLAPLLLAPLLEETVFRGGLQEWLLRRLTPPLLANVLTALAFAAAHAGVRHDAAAFWLVVPALGLGALYQQRRRIRWCVVSHAALNLLWLAFGAWTLR